jgi:tRNA(Ile)-lysidine synthase TilS/MesJ
MISLDRVIKLKKENTQDYNVLKSVLEKNFTVKSGNDFTSQNLSELSEQAFSNIIKGNFKPILAIKPNKPLFFLSDKEIELYAKLKGIKGKKRKENKRIKLLFQKFLEKNPDLEHNVINALGQLL